MCDLCGSSRYYLVYKQSSSQKPRPASPAGYTISESELEKPEKVVRCMVCGLIYAIPGFQKEELVHDYKTMADPEYLKEEKGRRAQARMILSNFPKKPGGQLLDIGCGPGFFLDEAKKAGWQVRGVDLSEWAKKYSHDHFGIDVFTGSLKEAKFPNNFFDRIVMNDVIEHLENPKEMLQEIRRILKNDGILYLSTPDIGSFLSRFLRARWWGVNKYHLFYFSRKTMEQMFEVVGFKKIRYSAYPRIFSLGYWVKRLEGYPWFVRAPFSFLLKMGAKDFLLKINLHDQIGVTAKKIQRLDTVITSGEIPSSPVEKKKVVVVLPAYNAEKTLERTVADIPKDIVDEIILVDDVSRDKTVKIAKELGLTVYQHKKNKGYGGNQKTCYDRALEKGADIVVMVHPDYQYDPTIIPELVLPILQGKADAVFGSRMMKGGALEGGMPLWKHNANILLTAFENVVLGTYLTEYHSGFRAYSATLLKQISYSLNSDAFVFDTEIIVQILANRFRIDEVPIRTRYFEEASSIRLWPSIRYGLGIISVMCRYFFHRIGWFTSKQFRLKNDGDAG